MNERWVRDAIDRMFMDEEEIQRLRADNEKLRAALNGWQEWWALPWQDKRPDIAELIYRRAAAALKENDQ